MTLLTLFFESPVTATIVFVGIVLAIGIHEFAHAFSATKLGDPTPKLQGRLTLNPIAHLDPVGTLLIILAGIGWGKPVEFNPNYLKNPRRDAAIVALAGPVSNVLIAFVSTLALVFAQNEGLAAILFYFITLNIALAVFNLIPIEPLDGFKVVAGILPPHLAYQWEDTRRYGIFVLLALFLTGAVGRIMFPIVDSIVKLLLGIFGINF